MTAAEALGCEACRLPISPCLVCANPFSSPQVDDFQIKTCRSCGVVNPLGDKCRDVLDIPPTSALPSAIVRRAQIARVGRRPYVLAKHAQFMHLSSVSKRKGEDEQDRDLVSHGLVIQEIFPRHGPTGSPVPEIFASAEEGHPLAFLPYMQDTYTRESRMPGEGRLNSDSLQQCARRHQEAVDARLFYPFSDSELPMKRMLEGTSFPSSGQRVVNRILSPAGCKGQKYGRRLSLRQEVDECEKKLSGSVYSVHQVQALLCNGGCVAAVSNDRTSSMCTPFKDDPANPGEARGKLAADLGLSAEPRVQSSNCHSTLFKSKCKDDLRAAVGDADDGEVRSTGEGGKTLIPLNGPLETLHDVIEHRVCCANQLTNNKINEPCLQFVRSTIKSLENALRHEGGPEASISGAALSNGSVDHRGKHFEHDFYPELHIENVEKLPSTSMEKINAEAVDAHESEGNDKPVRDITGSEEAPTHRHERVCSECDQIGEGSGNSSSNFDEAELMRCCTQLLELHCPHTLKADMRPLCPYPLCCPIPKFPLSKDNFPSSSKVCRSYVTQVSVDTLRAAHSTLTLSTQESTSVKMASPLSVFGQALSIAERFIEMKDRIDHVQGLIQRVDAASAQASRDFKAYGNRGAFMHARQFIPRLLRREKQQHLGQAKDDIQVMATFLQDINKLLTTCFQYVGKILEASLCSVGVNHADSSAANLNVVMLDIDTKRGLEAIRIAVPLWLRLYHDVAHSSRLFA